MTPSRRSGQVMMLTALTLGGTLLGATTVAGLLMLYQIRQSTDFSESARALFAADAGVEWTLYNVLCASDGTKTPCPVSETPPMLSNGARVVVTCRDEAGVEIPNCTSSSTISVKSIGTYHNSARAFCLFEACSDTPPTPTP